MTNAELSVGHQITQTAHVIAELAIAHPEHFTTWHDVSQSIIVLQTPSSESLTDLYMQSKQASLTVQAFREPDLGDEITALAYLPSPETVRFLSSFPLAGKRLPDADVARVSESLLKRISLQLQGTVEFNRGRVLRDCYFAFIDHLRSGDALCDHENFNDCECDLPTYSLEERDALLQAQPAPWVMDRGLTFFFTASAQQRPYAHDERISNFINRPEIVSGWDVVMASFNRKELV